MFLCCGDALFDLFAKPAGNDIATLNIEGRIGGSPLNVALGLARLGHHSAFFTKLSEDLFGRKIRAFMAAENIDQQFLIPTRRSTTLAVVSLSESGAADYDFHIDGTADRSIRQEQVPDEFPDALAAIHIGSYTTVTEPTASALLKLIGQQSARRFISYDPNIRASIEPDLDVWRAQIARILEQADFVKASEDDLAQIYPGRALDSVLADWVSVGPAMAIVTMAEHGAIAFSATGHEVQVPGLPVAVIDTVGAGDTFQAASLAHLAETGQLSAEALRSMSPQQIRELLSFAIKAAAITCSRRGADLPRRNDLGLLPLA
ncbi:carbohydrate kinase [Aureimonas fodinaquatilis]|uniref:Carbohydrate kinase n=1 Tax=Aureimonas fodinaquatilis TaxID=2565783 RepID=A0A5B0E1X6_9HYPH|nr:carbohydrate kinase [Aureimonas fodinaquatilis]KAA0972292.1 carbohydrate kinase [Aureimonas fodinaquatilis]